MSERPPIARASDEHAAGKQLPASVGVARRRAARDHASSPHSGKFRVVTAALVLLALGALSLAVSILLTGGGTTQSARWSEWSPSDSGSLGAREIADHMAPLYRISPVDQLAVVTLVNLSSSSSATSASSAGGTGTGSSGLQVAVQPNAASSAVSVLTGKTIAYNLCGIGGSNCAIGVGQPSADRLLLLRREALELSLYTFKYLSGVDNVVAILPPGHTTATGTLSAKPPSANTPPKPLNVALLFLRSELQPWLSAPLAATFPEPFPPTVPQMRAAPEAGLVEQITARGMFSQSLVQAQDGSNLMVLTPLPPE